VQAELEAWRTWKKTKDPVAFEYLVNSYQGLFNDMYNQKGGRSSTLPKSAIMSRQLREFIPALETYDPNRGAQLKTHVTWKLRRIGRYIRDHKNVARVPDNRATQIGTYRSREAWLNQQLGRAPTTNELADDLAESPDDVAKLRREIDSYHKEKRKELSESPDLAAIAVNRPDAFQGLLERIHPELDAEQQAVLEHRYGMFGLPPVQSLAELGKKLNMTSGRIRTVHRKIKKRVDDLVAQDTSWRLT
jgi:RNA polymerase primary sigma factor